MTSANFIDANVFVYANTNCPWQEQARKIAATPSATDALVLIETHVKLKTILQREDLARKIVRQIMSIHEIIPITQDTVFDAIKQKDMNIFDAVHLVCAQGKTMQTFDAKLAKAAKTLHS